MTNIKYKILNFQYLYDKLFNLGINRKKFESEATNDKLFAMNTSKNTLTYPKAYSLDIIRNVREGILDEDSMPLYDKILHNMKLTRKLLFKQATCLATWTVAKESN